MKVTVVTKVNFPIPTPDGIRLSVGYFVTGSCLAILVALFASLTPALAQAATAPAASGGPGSIVNDNPSDGPSANVYLWSQRYPGSAGNLPTQYPGGKDQLAPIDPANPNGPQKSVGPGTVSYSPVQTWPVVIPQATTQVPTIRDTSIMNNAPQFNGYPLTDSEFWMLGAANDDKLVADLTNPERWQWTTQAMTHAALTAAGDGASQAASVNQQNGIEYCRSFLNNFTSDPTNEWNYIRNQLFIPIAILLLLPGAVLAQVRAIVAQGFYTILGEVNPLEGLLRALIAAVIISGTGVWMSIWIDISNSITISIAQGYQNTFGTNMYEDAKALVRRANATNPPNSNLNAVIPSNPASVSASTQAAAAGATGNPLAQWDLTSHIDRLLDPTRGIDQTLTPNENLTDTQVMQRLITNLSSATMGTAWLILCAFQMVFLYYLWCMGPIVAALWVWPINAFRQALPSWIEAVCTLCFWSLFWSTTILLMACFKGVGVDGAAYATAFSALANLAVVSAFNFTNLISGAAGLLQSSMAAGATAGAQTGAATGATGMRGSTQAMTGGAPGSGRSSAGPPRTVPGGAHAAQGAGGAGGAGHPTGGAGGAGTGGASVPGAPAAPGAAPAPAASPSAMPLIPSPVSTSTASLVSPTSTPLGQGQQLALAGGNGGFSVGNAGLGGAGGFDPGVPGGLIGTSGVEGGSPMLADQPPLVSGGGANANIAGGDISVPGGISIAGAGVGIGAGAAAAGGVMLAGLGSAEMGSVGNSPPPNFESLDHLRNSAELTDQLALQGSGSPLGQVLQSDPNLASGAATYLAAFPGTDQAALAGVLRDNPEATLQQVTSQLHPDILFSAPIGDLTMAGTGVGSFAGYYDQQLSDRQAINPLAFGNQMANIAPPPAFDPQVAILPGTTSQPVSDNQLAALTPAYYSDASSLTASYADSGNVTSYPDTSNISYVDSGTVSSQPSIAYDTTYGATSTNPEPAIAFSAPQTSYAAPQLFSDQSPPTPVATTYYPSSIPEPITPTPTYVTSPAAEAPAPGHVETQVVQTADPQAPAPAPPPAPPAVMSAIPAPVAYRAAQAPPPTVAASAPVYEAPAAPPPTSLNDQVERLNSGKGPGRKKKRQQDDWLANNPWDSA